MEEDEVFYVFDKSSRIIVDNEPVKFTYLKKCDII